MKKHHNIYFLVGGGLHVKSIMLSVLRVLLLELELELLLVLALLLVLEEVGGVEGLFSAEFFFTKVLQLLLLLLVVVGVEGYIVLNSFNFACPALVRK